MTHAGKTGVAQFACESEEQALDDIKRPLVSPTEQRRGSTSRRPVDDPDRRDEELNEIVPPSPQKPYDIVDVVDSVVDEGSFFEVADNFAQEIVVGFARLDGRSVGIVANQPRVNAGTLTVDLDEGIAVRPLL